VRAGARRRLADFCSDKGKEALSSLAAAAGGGVTFGTQAWGNESATTQQKRQSAYNGNTRKQEADMRQPLKWFFTDPSAGAAAAKASAYEPLA
jgi:hypothetical protein